MFSHHTSQILILNIGMCFLAGTDDQGKRTLFFMIITPLMDMSCLPLFRFLLFTLFLGGFPLQKLKSRILCTSQFNSFAFPFLRAGLKAQVHLKEKCGHFIPFTCSHQESNSTALRQNFLPKQVLELEEQVWVLWKCFSPEQFVGCPASIWLWCIQYSLLSLSALLMIKNKM